MAKKAKATPTRVRFTVKCKSHSSLAGMIQTEDKNEREKRVLLDGSGIAELMLESGNYVFVWAVKMSPVQRHRYSVIVEHIPADGDPIELRKRPTEQTTTKGEDVGWDDFIL